MKKTQTAPAPAEPENTQAAAEKALPTQVDVRISSIRPEGSVRAIASVNLNNCFAIRTERITANADYIGIVNALNWLVAIGKISVEDSRKTAARIALQLGVSILIV